MIRRVQQIGKSGSFILTLPKSWCIENKVEHGIELELGIDQIKEGSILITLPHQQSNHHDLGPALSYLDFDSLEDQRMIARAILGRYLDGADGIIITDIPQEMKLDVRKTIKRLSHKLYVERETDIIDGRIEINFSSNLTSPLIVIEDLFGKARNMVMEAKEAYFTKNIPLAQDIILRDEDADKEYFRIVRTLKQLLRDPVLANEIFAGTVGASFSIVDSLDLRMIATYLENLADSAELLSVETVEGKEKINENEKEMSGIFNHLDILLERSFESFKLENQTKAFSILTEVRELKKSIENKFEDVNPALRNTLNELIECVIDIADLVGE